MIRLIIGILFLLATLSSSSFANAIYPLPPPNDTSLDIAHPYPKAKRHSHRKHHKAAIKPLTLKVKPHKTFCRHPAQRATGLYVYYDLPAPACCGETWTLHKTRCCAHEGVWPSSPYATFKVAPGDLNSSPTNDDEERSYDMYRDIVADETIDDPEYY